MKGNEKISFTAEAVAFMRAYENTDKFSKYFLGKDIKKKYSRISRIIPSSYLNKIFLKRINLSKELDKIIDIYKPQQIIELAAGYSPRGLILTQKNKRLVYLETDFSSLIKRKKEKLKEIEENEKIKLSKNHKLISIDAISNPLLKNLEKYIDRNKKTLIIAETLTSYLDKSEHEFLIRNINSILDYVDEGAYLSHEGSKMLKGIFGKLLIIYRNVVSKTKSHRHFKNEKQIENFFLSRGFKHVKTYRVEKINQIIYLAKK